MVYSVLTLSLGSIAKVQFGYAMADKFDRSMDDFRLNVTDDDDEVNTRGDNSPRMITAAGSLLVYYPHIISRHTAQIAFPQSVRQQVVELKEANKANEEKNATSVDKLESDKAALQKKLSSLEVKLESVRLQGVELKEANKANEEKNATLEEKLEKLSKKVDEMSKTLDENALENASRKKEIKNVQETVQLMALSGGFDKKPLTQSSEQQARVEKATINLVQLCWKIQAMMYQSVFPHCYDDKTSYKVKHIEEDIDGMSDDQLKDEVKQRWDELKKKLNWKKARHQRAMKSVQDSSNQTAHPTLTEKVLVDSADLMNKEGRLSGWHSYECVKELIEMWKTLKQQQLSRKV